MATWTFWTLPPMSGAWLSRCPWPVVSSMHGHVCQRQRRHTGHRRMQQQLPRPPHDTLFFDFATEKWQVLEAKLNVPRMRMRMVDIGGKPTVVGGYYDSLLDTIEEFDGEKWVMRADKLEMKRYAYGMPSFLPESVATCK